MNQKELTKIFMMISNWKNPSVSVVHTKLFQRFKGWRFKINSYYYGIILEIKMLCSQTDLDVLPEI